MEGLHGDNCQDRTRPPIEKKGRSDFLPIRIITSGVRDDRKEAGSLGRWSAEIIVEASREAHVPESNRGNTNPRAPTKYRDSARVNRHREPSREAHAFSERISSRQTNMQSSWRRCPLRSRAF